MTITIAWVLCRGPCRGPSAPGTRTLQKLAFLVSAILGLGSCVGVWLLVTKAAFATAALETATAQSSATVSAMVFGRVQSRILLGCCHRHGFRRYFSPTRGCGSCRRHSCARYTITRLDRGSCFHKNPFLRRRRNANSRGCLSCPSPTTPVLVLDGVLEGHLFPRASSRTRLLSHLQRGLKDYSFLGKELEEKQISISLRSFCW